VLTPSELRQSVLITSGGLAKVLQQLESRGLVARLADRADRRVKPVQLTAEALPIIEGVVGELLSQARAWLSGRLSDLEIEQAAALLKKLAEEPESR
jgi:DNA-binding MarR family transcriptional regulator